MHVKFKLPSTVPHTEPNRAYLGSTIGKVIKCSDNDSTAAKVDVEYPNGQVVKGIRKGLLGIWGEQLKIYI